jgi:hypothetical protein
MIIPPARELFDSDMGEIDMHRHRSLAVKSSLILPMAVLLLPLVQSPAVGQAAAVASPKAADREITVCLPDKLRSERNRPAKANAIMVKTSDVRPPHPSVIARTRVPTKPARFVLCPVGANQP